MIMVNSLIFNIITLCISKEWHIQFLLKKHIKKQKILLQEWDLQYLCLKPLLIFLIKLKLLLPLFLQTIKKILTTNMLKSANLEIKRLRIIRAYTLKERHLWSKFLNRIAKTSLSLNQHLIIFKPKCQQKINSDILCLLK